MARDFLCRRAGRLYYNIISLKSEPEVAVLSFLPLTSMMSHPVASSQDNANNTTDHSCFMDLGQQLVNLTYPCPVNDVRNATDFSFVLICAFLIFFMKGGFVMLEYGACNIGPVGRRLLLRMKVIDTVLGALTFWLVGYSIAFSPNNSPFEFNKAQFKDLEMDPHHLEIAKSTELWEFHFAFAANAATVVTGAVVGRVQLLGYVVGTIALTGMNVGCGMTSMIVRILALP